METNQDLQLLADQTDDDALSEDADSSCTTGYDNDGSTGWDIFENGYDLAIKAAGSPIFRVDGPDQAYFFIGTLDEVRARLERLLAEHPYNPD